MAIDEQQRYIEPFNRINDILGKLNQTRSDILNRDPHPDRVALLNKGRDNLSDYEKKILALNPDIGTDKSKIENIDQLAGRLYDQKVSLVDGYNQLFGKALKASQQNIDLIQNATPEILAGQAIEEARKKGQVYGAATKFGATPSLAEKTISDITAEGRAGRAETLKGQTEALSSAIVNQQGLLSGLGTTLLNQLNNEIDRAAAAKKTGGGGGGGGGGTNLEGRRIVEKNGKKYKVYIDKNGKEVAGTEVAVDDNTQNTNTSSGTSSGGGILSTIGNIAWSAAPYLALGVGSLLLKKNLFRAKK